MVPEKASDYLITSDDLDKLFEVAKLRIPFEKFSEQKYFGRPACSLKLISTLSFMGFIESLLILSSAKLKHNNLSKVAQLEVNLYLCASLGATLTPSENQKVTVYIQSIIDGDFDKLACLVSGTDIGTYVTVVKYLCMWGHGGAARSLLKMSDTETINYTLTHLLSLSTLHGRDLTRVPEGQLREKWLTFFRTLSDLFFDFSSSTLKQFNQYYAFFLSGVGKHDEAKQIVNSYRSSEVRLHSFVEMRKALHEKKVHKAIKHADRLIVAKDQTEIVSFQSLPFNRDVAEKVLCETNELLRAAGVNVFIISGTLLGCVRDGRILEHDKDFDLGVIGWEAQFDVAQALLKSQNYTFSTQRLKGQNLYLLGAVHVPTGYAFDIFFFHENGNKYRHGIQFQLEYTIHYEFTKFTLREKEFLGHSFLIPDDYELFLEENYGKGWRTPDPNYFVKLESPALLEKSGVNFAYSIRHEMLDMLGKRVNPEKGRLFLEKMKKFSRQEDQPKPFIMNSFMKKLTEWSA